MISIFFVQLDYSEKEETVKTAAGSMVDEEAVPVGEEEEIEEIKADEEEEMPENPTAEEEEKEEESGEKIEEDEIPEVAPPITESNRSTIVFTPVVPAEPKPKKKKAKPKKKKLTGKDHHLPYSEKELVEKENSAAVPPSLFYPKSIASTPPKLKTPSPTAKVGNWK